MRVHDNIHDLESSEVYKTDANDLSTSGYEYQSK